MKREQKIIRISLLGVGTNVALAALKAIIGVLSGSIAVVVDAVNNLSDVLSNVITIIGTKLGAKPADKDHPFGHGRYEYLAGLIIAFIILAAGSVALYQAVDKILHPAIVSFDYWAFIIMGVSVIAKIFLGYYTKANGKKLDSASLVGSGTEALFDAVVTGATIVSALVYIIFGLNIDALVGAGISLLIVKTGIELIRNTTNDILGSRPDSQLSRSIKKEVSSFPEVGGAYDLSLNLYGPGKMIGALNIEVPEGMSAREIHALSVKIQKRIMEKFGAYLYVGIYANRVDKANLELKQNLLEFLNDKFPQVLQIHAFFFDEKEDLVQFDAVLDFSVKNWEEYSSRLENALKKAWPQYNFAVKPDPDLSD